MECICSPSAYQDLASKLLQSYELEALVDETQLFVDNATKHVEAFLAEIAIFAETMYPGVCLGNEYRYESQTMACASLVLECDLLHASFHRILLPVLFACSYSVLPSKRGENALSIAQDITRKTRIVGMGRP